MDFFTIFFTVAYLLLIISTVVVILTENSNPSKTVAWLLILMVLPLIGIILYYVFGYNPRRSGRSEENFIKFRNRLFAGISVEKASELGGYVKNEEVAPEYLPLISLLQRSNQSDVLFGSDVEVITSGQRKFEALMEDLENARHHIHIEYFYFRRDATGRRIREILMRKAGQGVKVRFIYENIANIDISPRYYYAMRESGVEVMKFTKASLPWIRRNLNYRDHRKIVVIDGRIGYTGGMNIGDDYSIKWRDTHLRILGAGVYSLQTNFLHAWYESGGGLPGDLDAYFPKAELYSRNLMQIVPEAPDSRWPYLQMSIVNLIQNAKKYIYIQTPYYIPPEPVYEALKSAALSGVEVRIMVSRKSDIFFMDPVTQSYYEESLRAGIKIYELTDIFSHAKSIVADDYLSVIGSANMDARSLDLSFEINTYMYDADIAAQNRTIFFDDMNGCREVLLHQWLKRPLWKKLIQSVMKLFSPLL